MLAAMIITVFINWFSFDVVDRYFIFIGLPALFFII